MGAALSPFNTFNILKSLETLSLRMERHAENAMSVADHLHNHEQISCVNYAGLPEISIMRSLAKYALVNSQLSSVLELMEKKMLE